MGTIFEKVTYYDLYGYTIPGCLLVILCCLGDFSCLLFYMDKLPKEAYPYIFWVFIFLGMIIGIIMSEISKCFLRLISGKNNYKLHLTEKSMGISYKVIKQALVKAGIEDMVAIRNPEDVSRWFGYMYSCVQTDKKYSRIHNYASSQLMYRNLSIAIIIGGSVMAVRSSIWIGYRLLVFLASTGAGILLGLRSERFGVKKEIYAIYWFIDKFLGNQEEKGRRKE